MKRFVIILISILLLILDNSFSPFIAIKGIYPSLLFVFAIAYSIINGKEKGIFIGVVSGLLQDIFFFHGFGVNALINMFCCLIAALIGEGIWKNKKLIPIGAMFLTTTLKALAIFVIMYLLKIKVDLISGILAGLYNSIIMFLTYKLVYKLSDEESEKANWRFK